MNGLLKRGLGRGLLVLAAMAALLSSCKEEPGNQICTVRSDCSDGERCGIDGHCTKEEQKCQSDASCASDEYCKFTNVAASEGSCEASKCQSGGADTCGVKHTCLNDVCVAGCDGNEDCTGGEKCDDTSHQCALQGCETDSQCDPYQKCDTSKGGATGECVYSGKCKCQGEEDCKTSLTGNDLCSLYASVVSKEGEEYYCNGTSCKRKPACRGDSDCGIGSGMICVEVKPSVKACRPGCRSDSDCSSDGGTTSGTTKMICKSSSNPAFRWKTCQPGCNSDTDCNQTSETCYEKVCVPTCASVAQCTEGQVCKTPIDGSKQICQNCSNSNSCDSGSRCNFFKDENGNVKNEGLCKVYTTCPDDSYGSNISTNPYQITSLPFEAVGDKHANLCIGSQYKDGDFFKFNLPSNHVATVQISYKNDGGGSNLDLELIDSTSNKVEVASIKPPNKDGGKEEVKYGVAANTELVVKVSGTSIEDYVPYDLTITSKEFKTSECKTDALDKGAASSHLLENSKPVGKEQRYDDLYVCSGKEDIYSFKVEEKQYAEFKLYYDKSFGVLDVKLYDDVNLSNQVNAEIKPIDGGLHLTIGPDIADSKKTYYLVVKLQDGEVGQIDYSMTWVNYENICVDDGVSNDTCQDASEITLKPVNADKLKGDWPPESFPKVSIKYNVCKSDFYKFTLLPDRKAEIFFCYGGSVTDEVDGSSTMTLSKRSSSGSGVVCNKNNDVRDKKLVATKDNQPDASLSMGRPTCQRLRLTTDPAQSGIGEDDYRKVEPGEYAIEYAIFNGGRVSYKIAAFQAETKLCTALGNTSISKAEEFDSTKAANGTGNTKFGKVCDTDKYWYKVGIKTAGDYEVTLVYDQTTYKNVSAKLYFVPDGKTFDDTTDATIRKGFEVGNFKDGKIACKSSECDGPGTLYVEVSADSNGARVAFRLSLNYDGQEPNGGSDCPDSQEENDSFGDAKKLTLSSSSSGKSVEINNLSVCYLGKATPAQNDGDFYKLEVEPGDHYTVTFSKIDDISSVSLERLYYCFNPDGENKCDLTPNVVPSSSPWKLISGASGKFNLQGSKDRKGTLYLYAGLNQSTEQVEAIYKLKVEVTNSGCTQSPNGVDSPSTPVELDENISQTYYSSRACSGKPNYFKVKVPARVNPGDKWSLVTRYNFDDADLTTEVKSGGSVVNPDSSSGDLTTSGNKKVGKRLVFERPPNETEYTIEVTGKDSQADFALVLNMDYHDSSPANANNIDTLNCPDRYRPTSSSKSSNSPLLGQGETRNLSMCSGSDSGVGFSSSGPAYFRYKVFGNSTLKVAATYQCQKYSGTVDPTLQLKLYEGTTNTPPSDVTSSVATGKVGLSYKNGDPQTKEYTLEVSVNNGSGYCTYSLDAELSYDDPCTPPKQADLNGVILASGTKTAQEEAKEVSATTIEQTMSRGIVYLCEKTEQVFKLKKGVKEVNATIQYVGAMGAVKATLYHYNSTDVRVNDAVSTAVGDVATLKYTLDPLQQYYVELSVEGGARSIYKIWLETDKQRPNLKLTCRDDKEINDAFAYPTSLSSPSSSSTYSPLYHAENLNICWADQDYFKVKKDSNDYYVGVYGDDVDKLKVEFLDENGASFSPTPVEVVGSGGVAELNIKGSDHAEGSYFIKIASKDATPAEKKRPYLLLATPASAFGSGCKADQFDGTSPVTPIPVTDTFPKTYFATVCSGDEDVFSVKVKDGETVKVMFYSKKGISPTITYPDPTVPTGQSPVAFVDGKATYTYVNNNGSTRYLKVTVGDHTKTEQYPYFITFEKLP